jgi:succinate dehydrogenase/fumarate reductase-like Fe-S protein
MLARLPARVVSCRPAKLLSFAKLKIPARNSRRSDETFRTGAPKITTAGCIAGCGTVRMREDFVGAVGLNKIARFRLDPRDQRSDEDFYELIGDDDGVFGCMSLLGCHDVCPKNLPLSTQIAFLRRKMAAAGWK